METLTLSSNVTAAGEFTLSISQSSTMLAARENPLDVTLTFRDNRASDESSETRTIAISIVSDDIPPTPGNIIMAISGATSVTITFEPAYDTVGSSTDTDSSNYTFTRDVDYIITITRLARGDKPMLTLPSMTMTAEELDVNLNPVPLTESEAEEYQDNEENWIEILLTRSDVTLLPSDSYRVSISVIDDALRRSTEDGTFTMLGHENFPHVDFPGVTFRDFLSRELAGVNCTGDSDGIADAYEQALGTDCNGSVDDYTGPVDPTDPTLGGTITVPPLPPGVPVQVIKAGASTYTQISTADVDIDGNVVEYVECIGDCSNLKAFIVSSGLTEDDPNDSNDGPDADPVAMATGTCSLDNALSNPNSCWDDVSVDVANGNVGAIPLPLGYSVIHWVAADAWDNLILGTRKRQLVYVAPVVVFNGATVLVLRDSETTVGGTFKVEEIEQSGGDSISFIGATTRSISDVSMAFTRDCDPASASITVSQQLTDDEYRYTVTSTDAATCRIAAEPTRFGDPLTDDPFYVAEPLITVQEANDTTNRVAPVNGRIEEIVVTDVDNFDTTVAAVVSGDRYRVASVNAAEIEVRILPQDELLSPDNNGIYMIPSEEGLISIQASSAGLPVTTHMEPYPILPVGTTLEVDADNDGVPDDDDAMTGPGHDGDSTLLSDSVTGATIEVPFGYRVALGNTARRNGPYPSRVK